MYEIEDNVKKFIADEFEFGAKNYNPAPLVLKRAKGCELWDINDKKYIDLVSAYSAVSLGHGNKKIVKAMTSQALVLDVTSRAVHNNVLPRYLELLTKVSGYSKALPMNSGAEAVETALKIARKWGEKVKGISENSTKIIACTNNFHGRTLAIISLSTEPQYRDGFGPYLPGVEIVEYGNISQLEEALEDINVAAFIIEPIQGEAGINVPPQGYLKQAFELCKSKNVLFIADEVQTGLMRTGALFCCDHENIKPDLMVLGKALGGGVYPVSAVLTSNEIMAVITPGDHGSTFGGNPIACAVGIEALTQLTDKKLQDEVVTNGEWALAFLRKKLEVHSSFIKDIRGKGLFIGIEFQEGYLAKKIVYAMLEAGVLVKDTHESVLRIAPPLVITKKQLKNSLKKLVKVIVNEFSGE